MLFALALGLSSGARGETGLNRSKLLRCRNAGKLTSCHFVGRSGDVDLNLLHTKVGMDRFQDRLAGIFLSANPDCPGPAYQRKRIVANQICRALQFKLDRVVGEGAHGAEFVGHSQHDASRIGSIGLQSSVIRKKQKLRVHNASDRKSVV